MTVYTIGYGGRTPDDFLGLLTRAGVRAVADVRLRPDRSGMGVWTKAKTPDKGIEKLLAGAGIGYHSLVELGNVFRELPDWQDRYRALIDRAGDLLVARLDVVPAPFCLMCAEKKAADCHRRPIAEFLARTRGAAVVHLE